MFLTQAIVVEQWTPEILLLIWGVFQSLALEYIPKLSDWYGGLGEDWKRFTQAIGLAVVSILVLVLACNDIVGGIACDQAGIVEVFIVWILGLMANQTTHRVFKKKSPA
jgi:hypothetical protein